MLRQAKIELPPLAVVPHLKTWLSAGAAALFDMQVIT
jgi:hypothetical protein